LFSGYRFGGYFCLTGDLSSFAITFFCSVQFSFSDVTSDEYSSSNRRSSVEEARDSLSHRMAPAAIADGNPSSRHEKTRTGREI